MKTLNFYKQPFHRAKYGSWVYDAKGNFVFQFEPIYDSNGNYEEGEIELQDKIIKSLNSKSLSVIENLNLKVGDGDPNFIYHNSRLLIVIRGWGNLTGIGAHNFDDEKASKIRPPCYLLKTEI